MILGDPAGYKTIVRRVLKATPALVQSAASRWLSDLNLGPLLLLDADGKPKETAASP